MVEDGLLEGVQVRAGIQSKLVDHHGAGAVKGLQRVVLPAVLILRQRQQPPSPLAERSFLDQANSRPKHLAEPPAPQQCLRTKILGVASQLDQSLQLDPSRCPVGDLEEGLAAPQAKGCLLYTSPSPRDGLLSRMPSSA